MPLPPPNHTQTPNIFFDDSLPKIKSLAEIKIILAVVRQTFGWHKTHDQLSFSQLRLLTGLTRQGVSNGLSRALTDGFIEREPDGQSFIYRLKVVSEVDQSSTLTSPPSRPKPVNKIDQQVVNEVDTQKKQKKERKETVNTQQRGTRLPDDFAITDSMRGWAKQYTPHVNPDAMLAEFVDYWHSIPGARGRKLDWPATWRNRMRDIEARLRNGNGYAKPTASERRVEQLSQNAELLREDNRSAHR